MCNVNGINPVTDISFDDTGRISLNGSTVKPYYHTDNAAVKQRIEDIIHNLQGEVDVTASNSETRTIRIYTKATQSVRSSVYLLENYKLVWLREFGCYVFKDDVPTIEVWGRNDTPTHFHEELFDAFRDIYDSHFDIEYGTCEGAYIFLTHSRRVETFDCNVSINYYERTDCFQCEDCGDHFGDDELGSNHRCDNCHENYESCNDDDDDRDSGTVGNVQDECRRAGLNSYTNPLEAHGFNNLSTRLIEGKPRYFGLELELEFESDPTEELNNSDIVKPLKKYWGVKGDGSLDDGIEFVSNPMGIDCCRAALTSLLKDSWVKDYCEARSTGGLHVHVSRDTISEVTITLLRKFMKHNKVNSDLDTLAGRPEVHWCERGGDIYFNARMLTSKNGTRKMAAFDSDKYRAVHIGLSKTVEFRLFSNSLDVDTLMQRVQFVDALIEYLTERKLTVETGLLDWDNLIKWIVSSSYHVKLWPELVKYFNFDKRLDEVKPKFVSKSVRRLSKRALVKLNKKQFNEVRHLQVAA